MLPGDIGHAFPTGDLFRRAELTVSTDVPAPPQVIGFAREFAPSLERSPRGALVFVRHDARLAQRFARVADLAQLNHAGRVAA